MNRWQRENQNGAEGKGKIGDGRLGKHAPQVQEFGEMMARSMHNRTRSCEDELICAC